eukprot:SAG22_NODE_12655_length_434_cov_1.083582_1_plen_70_part_10
MPLSPSPSGGSPSADTGAGAGGADPLQELVGSTTGSRNTMAPASIVSIVVLILFLAACGWWCIISARRGY